MTDRHDPDDFDPGDEALLAELGEALGRESLPDGLLERADALSAWFDVDTELVALLVEGSDELVGTRGSATETQRFATTERAPAIEIEIESSGRRVVGHVVRGQASAIRLQAADGTPDVAVVVDQLGRFDVAGRQPGPHRLQLVADGSSVVTDWFVLTEHNDERT